VRGCRAFLGVILAEAWWRDKIVTGLFLLRLFPPTIALSDPAVTISGGHNFSHPS